MSLTEVSASSLGALVRRVCLSECSACIYTVYNKCVESGIYSCFAPHLYPREQHKPKKQAINWRMQNHYKYISIRTNMCDKCGPSLNRVCQSICAQRVYPYYPSRGIVGNPTFYTRTEKIRSTFVHASSSLVARFNVLCVCVMWTTRQRRANQNPHHNTFIVHMNTDV